MGVVANDSIRWVVSGVLLLKGSCRTERTGLKPEERHAGCSVRAQVMYPVWHAVLERAGESLEESTGSL